ncbi:MAG: HD domain-containing protein [Gallionella sp.]|nr:HD domain-containing protein [Gallionella sp.]
MAINPASAEISRLFANNNPDEVWQKAGEIIGRISATYDVSFIKTVFDDVVRLFRGAYKGFCPIKTPYHDLHHTLDVFLCATRLMHGVHLSGTCLTDDEITIVMMGALMHDVGYAQREGEETGTGAQHTKCHVDRGIEFFRQYVIDKNLPATLTARIRPVILCSNPAVNISDIQFPDERTRLLGKILGTADVTGQMADRTYLEKLLFLYLEFEEARFSNYQNIHDLLRNTQIFYEATRLRLRDQFDGINGKLALHFKDWYGVERNYYIEAIEKNIAYLDKITSLQDVNHLSMLKRGGIVEKTEPLVGAASDRPVK